MQVALLNLHEHHKPLKQSIMNAIEAVVSSDKYIMGPCLLQFERELAAYLGVSHAVGVSSGTDALLVSLMAIDVGPGDAVITTTFSFFATAGVITRLGARPYFADIEADSFNISPFSAEQAILKAKRDGYRVKAIIPVHLYGQCARMDSILNLAKTYHLKVVEDAAQAIGARYPQGNQVSQAGTLGDLGCYSFFPSKNLGCLGDGGLVVTDNSELADKVKLLRTHGARPKYYHALVGGNFRFDDIQAAVLSVKLPHLNRWHEQRKLNANRYHQLFKSYGLSEQVQLPVELYQHTKYGHIYNQFVIRANDRDLLRQYLANQGVGSETYYPVPFHLQECFRNLGYKDGDFPGAEKAAREVLALPVYPELQPGQQEYVVKCTADFYGN